MGGAWSVLLSLDSLCDEVAHDATDAARGVELDAKRLAGKEVLHTIDPKPLDRGQVLKTGALKLVEEGDVVAHVAETAATGASAFGGKNTADAVALEHRLNGTLTKTEHLAAARGDERTRIERQAKLAGVLGDDESDRERSFAAETIVGGKSLEGLFEPRVHYLKPLPCPGNGRLA